MTAALAAGGGQGAAAARQGGRCGALWCWREVEGRCVYVVMVVDVVVMVKMVVDVVGVVLGS